MQGRVPRQVRGDAVAVGSAFADAGTEALGGAVAAAEVPVVPACSSAPDSSQPTAGNQPIATLTPAADSHALALRRRLERIP